MSILGAKVFSLQHNLTGNCTKKGENLAAVSCSPMTLSSVGAGFGFWLTGKLGRAWVGALVGVRVGAWMLVLHVLVGWGYAVYTQQT